MENKKGLSTIITTLLIILLVLVAIGIVWVVVQNILTTGTENVGLLSQCPMIQLQIKGVTNCGLEATGRENCTVQLYRPSGGDMDDLSFRITASDGTTTGFADGGPIQQLATITKLYTLIPPLGNNATVVTVTPKIGDELCTNTVSYTIPIA